MSRPAAVAQKSDISKKKIRCSLDRAINDILNMMKLIYKETDSKLSEMVKICTGK